MSNFGRTITLIVKPAAVINASTGKIIEGTLGAIIGNLIKEGYEEHNITTIWACDK